MSRAPSPLRLAGFRRFWLAALVSNTGQWMQNAAIPVAVFQLSGTATAVGATGAVQYLPFMLMGAVGGTLADRRARRPLLVWVTLAQAATALLLWAVVAAGSAGVSAIAAMAFVAGLLGGLATPVWQSFVTELVPRDRLLGAVTLNSTQFNASRALGPFLAGIVIAAFGVQVAFLINAATFVVLVAVLVTLRGVGDRRPARSVDGPDPTAPGEPRAGVPEDRRVRPGSRQRRPAGMVEAARHVWASPPILACCGAIVAVAGLGSPLFNFLPVYGSEDFAVEGARLGLLLGAGGIGSLVAAPLLLTVGPRLPRARLLAGSMALYGVATAGVGFSSGYIGAVGALLVFGGSYLGIASTINTTIQLVVHDHLRGKVIAIYLMCLTGALPLGLLAWGVAAEWVGLRATTVGAGGLLIAVTALMWVSGRFLVMAGADAARDHAAGGTG